MTRYKRANTVNLKGFCYEINLMIYKHTNIQTEEAAI